jgi:adenosine kinase
MGRSSPAGGRTKVARVHLLLTGSVATDHLMKFSGRFADSIVAERLDRLSVSFLTDDLVVHRGGVAGNIATGVGRLGVPAAVLASVGPDFTATGYRAHLESLGIDCRGVHESATRQTARFTCITDTEQCQIASFYAGAMTEARDLPVPTGVDLVVVSPDDDQAMLRHTQQARDAGIPWVADVSQQINYLSDATEIRALIDGAAHLVTNDYERELLETKSGWSADEVLDRVGWRITTLGADGVVAERRGEPDIRVPAVAVTEIADPTGGGDAMRAGMLAGLATGLPLQRCLQVGSMLATLVLEAAGPQEYDLTGFAERFAAAFGSSAAAEVAEALPATA